MYIKPWTGICRRCEEMEQKVGQKLIVGCVTFLCLFLFCFLLLFCFFTRCWCRVSPGERELGGCRRGGPGQIGVFAGGGGGGDS